MVNTCKNILFMNQESLIGDTKRFKESKAGILRATEYQTGTTKKEIVVAACRGAWSALTREVVI